MLSAARLPAFALAVLAFALCAGRACADAPPADVVAPGPHLKVEGAPPARAALAARLAPYSEFRPRLLASWHPTERKLVVSTRVANTVQLNLVAAPLAPLEPLTDFADPVRQGGFWPAKPEALVFARDTGGNEQTQLYRLDAGAHAPTLLTDDQRAHRVIGINRARDRLLLGSVALDKNGKQDQPLLDLTLLDPLDPDHPRHVATLPGTLWDDADFSFDDKRVVLINAQSISESRVFVLDLETGKRTRVMPPADELPREPSASTSPAFARDGRHVFLTTDRDGLFQRAARLDLATGKLEYFGPDNWDAEDLRVSPDGLTVALVINEGGAGTLRLYDAESLAEIAGPKLPAGRASRLQWRPDSSEIAFNLESAASPNEVWSFMPRNGQVTRWTENRVAGIDPAGFSAPEAIQWKASDGLVIHGFLNRPPARFTGPRPVVVYIHGGPEGQSRPGFLGRWNYLIDAMGVAVIEPNVRGSTGYGKEFVRQDNGRLREESVKDIGALLDWIGTQKDLDATRVVVAGGSYGGYMSLATATHYDARIAGTIDVVGIANFVSFLENTESYRRDARRVEYGDERQPSMREFLTRISPVTNAAKITKPLLVVAGRNDPRVPWTESQQIVDTVRKNGGKVWYLLADNEGHGFQRKDNADYYFLTLVEFVAAATGTPALAP